MIEGAEINLKGTDKICIHALASLLHRVVALRGDVVPVKFGLTKEGDNAYVQCVGPGKHYTDGGTVVFGIEGMG